MLGRYQMLRGRRPADDPLPVGVRQDTRRHTRHCLRPETAAVDAFLADPTDDAWLDFERAYLATLNRRFREDAGPFEALAEQARRSDLHLGCSCPTLRNPNVQRCHTVLALGFLQQKYPDLEVSWPG